MGYALREEKGGLKGCGVGVVCSWLKGCGVGVVCSWLVFLCCHLEGCDRWREGIVLFSSSGTYSKDTFRQLL